MNENRATTTAAAEITEFILSELLGGDTAQRPDPDDNLLMSGLIDSIGMMRLVSFIEEQFGFAVPPEDFTIENFSSVNSIVNYVGRSAPKPANS